MTGHFVDKMTLFNKDIDRVIKYGLCGLHYTENLYCAE